MKKNEKIQLATIFIYLALLVINMTLILVFANSSYRYVFLWTFGGILLGGLLIVSLVSSLCNHYICPKCGYRFKINMFRDLFSSKGGKLGKKLKCPSCHETEYMKPLTDSEK